MPALHIDTDKCVKDGICIAECPFLLLEETEDRRARFIPEAESLCIECGHCLAVCPTGAVSINGITQEQLDTVDRSLALGPEQTANWLRSRRSVRSYKEDPVPRELVIDLLELTRWAPTARNQQNVHWLVAPTPETVRELAEMVADWLREKELMPAVLARWDTGSDIFLRNAPVLVAAHAPEESYRPEVDCSIALTSLELAAPGLGLGACWAGFFMNAAVAHAPLRERLALPEGHKVYGALMLGYSQYRYRFIPPRRELRLGWL